MVKIACIAQFVNVIAPIMTDPKGAAWRQTIYYPYYFASIYSRGTALNLSVNCPGYDAEVANNVFYIDIAGVHDEEGGTLTFFLPSTDMRPKPCPSRWHCRAPARPRSSTTKR